MKPATRWPSYWSTAASSRCGSPIRRWRGVQTSASDTRRMVSSQRYQNRTRRVLSTSLHGRDWSLGDRNLLRGRDVISADSRASGTTEAAWPWLVVPSASDCSLEVSCELGADSGGSLPRRAEARCLEAMRDHCGISRRRPRAWRRKASSHAPRSTEWSGPESPTRDGDSGVESAGVTACCWSVRRRAGFRLAWRHDDRALLTDRHSCDGEVATPHRLHRQFESSRVQ